MVDKSNPKSNKISLKGKTISIQTYTPDPRAINRALWGNTAGPPPQGPFRANEFTK